MCGAYLFSTTPCLHKPPTFSCPLASNALTWAAFSEPLPCFGFSTRNDLSRLCSGGAMAPCYFTNILLCAALASHTPWSARIHPPPLRRLAPDSCSVGLSPTLSLSFSPPLSPAPHSLSLSPLRSFPTASHSLSLSLSLSLSSIKGVFGTLGVSLSPPGFEPSSTGQKRCG